MALDIRETAGGAVFKVKAIPNAGRNGLAGEYSGMMKIKVAAAPEKGKANEELAGYLAELLGISKSMVSVVKGETAREKTVLVSGVKKQDILKLLEGKNG